jgi:hypothetical protein
LATRLPVRFILPCDLQLLIHDAGRLDLGLEQAPFGAGPMFSSVLYISNILIVLVFNTSIQAKLILCRM